MSADLLESLLDPVPAAPRTGGLLGEVEALHAALKAAGCEVAPEMLLGVSGLAFTFGFRVSTDTRSGHNPQFGWFRPALWDGPDPVRLAAKVGGFDFTAHFVNSTRTMFERVVASIDDGVAVLTRDPESPHHPCLIVGYACDRTLAMSRTLHMVRCPGDNGDGKAAGEHQQIRVDIIDDQDAVVLELGPWLNPVGVLQRRDPPDGDALGRQIRASLRRAGATSGTRVISGDGGGEMPDGDLLDDEVRSSLVRPSFESWARQVHGPDVDVVSLRIALNDLFTARTAAARFLQTDALITGWNTTAAGELYAQVAAGIDTARELVPPADNLPANAVEPLAAALTKLDEAETRAMAALKAAMVD